MEFGILLPEGRIWNTTTRGGILLLEGGILILEGGILILEGGIWNTTIIGWNINTRGRNPEYYY